MYHFVLAPSAHNFYYFIYDFYFFRVRTICPESFVHLLKCKSNFLSLGKLQRSDLGLHQVSGVETILS